MSPSEDRNWWKWRRDELTVAICIINPAGTEYEISESRLAQLDRDVATLLNDMLEGLIDLQNENEALRSREALHARAEGQSAFGLQAQVEALKSARAADKAGFEVVIRELRAEIAELREPEPCSENLEDQHEFFQNIEKWSGPANGWPDGAYTTKGARIQSGHFAIEFIDSDEIAIPFEYLINKYVEFIEWSNKEDADKDKEITLCSLKRATKEIEGADGGSRLKGGAK